MSTLRPHIPLFEPCQEVMRALGVGLTHAFRQARFNCKTERQYGRTHTPSGIVIVSRMYILCSSSTPPAPAAATT